MTAVWNCYRDLNLTLQRYARVGFSYSFVRIYVFLEPRFLQYVRTLR
jgi:hypothetical protein